MQAPTEFDLDPAAIVVVAVPNDLCSVKRPEREILRALARWGYDADTTFGIKLALEEALTNAVKHGNCNDASKRVTVGYYVDARRAVLMVRDEGEGFCPAAVPDPTTDDNLERPNGRGLMLMHAYMTKVLFNQRGNEVWLLKERPEHPR